MALLVAESGYHLTYRPANHFDDGVIDATVWNRPRQAFNALKLFFSNSYRNVLLP